MSTSADSLGKRNRLVITASTLGTVFEWYDFFIYGTLAALLAQHFFPGDSGTAAFLKSLAVFGAGFLVRPLGGIVFGHLGDLIGRKYTFLVTITMMGFATFAIALIPDYATIGIWAPILLVAMRLMQGLALGGEYGGAAIYVAEHAPPGKRGFYTSFIQMSAGAGFLLSIVVVLSVKAAMSPEEFIDWGWRVPFAFSLVILAISLYIRLKLSESPVYAEMKAQGKTSKSPLKEAFSTWPRARLVLIALFGVAAGHTVIWYTAQFSVLYFLRDTMRLDASHAEMIMAASVALGMPLMILMGWVSDKVGRKKVLLAGYGMAALLVFPLFHLLAGAANPALSEAMERAPVTVAATDCPFNAFAEKQTADCARAMAFLAKRGVSYEKAPGDAGADVVISVGGERVTGYDEAAITAALEAAGYPSTAEGTNYVLVIAIVLCLIFLSAVAYGPVAAIMTELFPAKVRYTSLSVPYHFGTGWFGGLLPFVSQYIIVSTGDVYAGLWYMTSVVVMGFLVVLFFLPETKDRDIRA
ncbi:MFS transporter [Iodidimonas sp. SYSU 1G8]|uniref:MFS transporter n=1 Tax=Iodidimonas sp. SYSU 1G8 TaxID=3133967 RepID=UPI0031FF11A4